MIAIDLSKQQALDFDPRSIQQITFTGNLDWAVGTTVVFILDFSQSKIPKVLWMCSTMLFCSNIIPI